MKQVSAAHHKKLKAGAMLFSVTIAFVLALIGSFVILFHYLGRNLSQRYDTEHRLILNSHSGIQLLLGQEVTTPGGSYNEIKDLYGNSTDSVELSRCEWGIFDLAVARAFGHSSEYISAALIGQYPEDRTVLWLADKNMPLIICGSSEIKGSCRLPQSGFKSAYLEGHPAAFKDPVKGETAQSTQHLPVPPQGINRRISQGFSNDGLSFHPTIRRQLPSSGDSLVNAFRDSLILIRSEKKITLDGIFLKGKIIISSKKEVFIRNTARIDGIQVYAPIIRIEAGTRGRFQAFASDSILAGKKCELSYPTVLALINIDSLSGLNRYIGIDSGSVLKGTVLNLKDSATDIRNSKGITDVLHIGRNVLVRGVINWDGLADPDACRIEGMLFCSGLRLRTHRGTYLNYLYNTVINIHALPEAFMNGMINTKNKKENVVQWLR